MFENMVLHKCTWYQIILGKKMMMINRPVDCILEF